jgi:hypothetical protein
MFSVPRPAPQASSSFRERINHESEGGERKQMGLPIGPGRGKIAYSIGHSRNPIWAENVMRKCKKLSILAIFFSLWLSLYTGYLYYDGLGEVDVLSPTLIFENPDQENLPADQPSKGKAFLTNLDPPGILERSNFSEPLLQFSLRTILLARLSVPLRC